MGGVTRSIEVWIRLLEVTEWEQHRCAHLSSQLFILVALEADDIVFIHLQRWR